MKPKFANTPIEDYRSLRSDDLKNETNDCAVIALMKVTGVTYDVAHAALAAVGRKPRAGTYTEQSVRAVSALGFNCIHRPKQNFISRYPGIHATALRHVTSHHPHRFNKVWADGKNYLMVVRGHIFATVNGVVEDWARQRCKRVVTIYEISKREAQS